MNDPWDVKSVKQTGHYTSCMKINGVPLLPPVLSKECLKEMQYYKLLAKEVEKRIKLLKPFISSSDSDASEDKTDAPELPESEQNYELPSEELLSTSNEKLMNSENEKLLNRSITNSPKLSTLSSNNSDKVCSNLTPTTNESSKLVIDLTLSFNQTDESTLHGNEALIQETHSDLPEHDNEISIDVKQKLGVDFDNNYVMQENKPNFTINNKCTIMDQFLHSMQHNGPSSLTSKSFTGSLHDIHKECEKSTQINPLIRQRSYTVLTPSPMLLAHLQIQSLSTGVEMTSISMSESLSNLTSSNKKRRSWDLETAKAKWSNMAMELKKKNIAVSLATDRKQQNKPNNVNKRILSRSTEKSKTLTLPRSRSVASENPRVGNLLSKPHPTTQSEPHNLKEQKSQSSSKVKNDNQRKLKEISPQKNQIPSECDDPAKRVRELYERIQKQQLLQMATLVEKQKKEQMLLQQVFEEQNNLLYNQLKTICPKSPCEAKEAWSDKSESPESAERGPVSLSQLINHKPLEPGLHESPVSSTLTDTSNYLHYCDNVLKKSRDITGSIKKEQVKSKSENCAKNFSATPQGDGGKIRTHSPNNRNTNTSRKLTYETSTSSDREYDIILTDRTNDTMADLNVTFPSDGSDDVRPGNQNGNVVSHLCGKQVSDVERSVPKVVASSTTDRAIKCVEDSIKNSIMDVRARLLKKDLFRSPTAEERAAATKIVAYARGYLVRRLMRTERVQSTVQTIRDALLCALQLHQDREGIRGADVDLHRRLIQQITAACYSLHDTFISSTSAERCALLAADRSRRRSLALRPSPRHYRPTDVMSQSHTGTFPSRPRRPSPSAMSQSHHESFSGEKSGLRARCVGSPRRRPWR